MKHDVITWGIGSSGNRCENFEHTIPEDLKEITCISCLHQFIVDYEQKIERLENDIIYYQTYIDFNMRI